MQFATDTRGADFFAAELPDISRPELDTPAPDGFVGEFNTALQQHFFHLTQAQLGMAVEPDNLSNNLRRETVALVTDRR